MEFEPKTTIIFWFNPFTDLRSGDKHFVNNIHSVLSESCGEIKKPTSC